MRALCWVGRAIGWLLILAGLAALGRDGFQWLDTGAWQSVPFGQVWADLHRNSLLLLQPALERHVAEFLWDPVMTTILLAPAWLVFLAPGIGLLLLTAPRRRSRTFRSR